MLLLLPIPLDILILSLLGKFPVIAFLFYQSFSIFFCRWNIFICYGTLMLIPFNPFTFSLFLTVFWVKYHNAFHSLKHLKSLLFSIAFSFKSYCGRQIHHSINNSLTIISVFFFKQFV